MGYRGAISWEKGQKWEVQESFPVSLDEIWCSENATRLAECSFSPQTSESLYCSSHKEDIFLTCDIGNGKWKLLELREYNFMENKSCFDA